MKFHIISPQGVPMNPVLFPNLISTFEAGGHSFVDSIVNCDCVLFDLHSRQFFYNENDIDYLCQTKIPIATFCEWDRGGLSVDEWPSPTLHQQRKVFEHIKNNNVKAVHFCRLLDKTKKYPPNLHPYEKPYSYEEPLLSAEELFNREYDICFIANESPSRKAIEKAIIEDGRFMYITRIGEKKLEFGDFLNLHKKAKLFISSGAGGFTDERVQCLFSIAGIIRERSNQLLLHDFDGCLRIDSPPTKEDLDIIYEIINDKDKLYKKYKSGYDFVKTYYSKEYIANDILKKILNTIND